MYLERKINMIYMLDTANIKDIKRACDLYPIAGVTTNPTLIAREKRPFYDILKDIRDIIGDDRMLHVQALSMDAEGIIKEAEHLQRVIGGNLYVKVPAIPEGIKAIKELYKRGIPVTATAICSAQQAILAAVAGADFVAPYVNRTDDININGVEVTSDIIRLFKLNNLKTKLLAASFKNVRQIHEVMMTGAQSVTIGTDLLEKLVENSLSEWSVNRFIEDWTKVYGENSDVTTVE
jgi:fructose-6-phosphate aldolase 2